MCGLIFHNDPSTGLHTLMAFFTLKDPKEIPHALDSFHESNGMDHIIIWGRGSSDYYRAYLGEMIWSMSLILCN